MKAQIPAFLIIIINLLNLIWINQIQFKRTINRRRRWKQLVVKGYFLLCPVVLILYLLKIEYIHFLTSGFALIGCWFAVSQLRFIKNHAGVPQLVEPVSFLHLFTAVALLGFSLLKLI